MFKKLVTGGIALAVALSANLTTAFAEDGLYIPILSYRTGPFAGGGVPTANGFADYMNMLNARDGGIGGVKVVIEECETAYNAQKGVECYEATKGKGALVYNPMSTGITLQLIPKAPVDEIPVLSMGYGLSAAAIGETFPWTFNYPASYWSQMSSVLKYIDANGGLKGKKIGFIYLDVGYGREPIPLLEQLAPEMGFELAMFPVAGKEMQAQSAQWRMFVKALNWMIMWGWGSIDQRRSKKRRKFVTLWTALLATGGHLRMLICCQSVTRVKGTLVQTTLASERISGHSRYNQVRYQTPDRSVDCRHVLYNRAVYNAVLVAEAIATAQKMTGKKHITGADMRIGLENFVLDQARLAELGLAGFTGDLKGDCVDHEGGGSVFFQQWTGSDFERITDPIAPMADVVKPLLEAAAAAYKSDKPEWTGQTCG